MCLSAKDAENAAHIAELIAPDSAKPYIHAVDEAVHVNENNHLEVDPAVVISEASKLLNK